MHCLIVQTSNSLYYSMPQAIRGKGCKGWGRGNPQRSMDPGLGMGRNRIQSQVSVSEGVGVSVLSEEVRVSV